MCQDCGCSAVATVAHSHDHHHVHHEAEAIAIAHRHDHHGHHQTVTITPDRQSIAIGQGILSKNDHLAHHNRELFQAKGLLVMNWLSSPGAGKTALIQKMIGDRHATQLGVPTVVMLAGAQPRLVRLFEVEPAADELMHLHRHAIEIGEQQFQLFGTPREVCVVAGITEDDVVIDRHCPAQATPSKADQTGNRCRDCVPRSGRAVIPFGADAAKDRTLLFEQLQYPKM